MVGVFQFRSLPILKVRLIEIFEGESTKILVAGGAGYLGSVPVPRLLERGYSVDVVELFWFGNHLPNAVGILNKDILDLSVEDLRPYEQVIFLAGLSNDPMDEFSPSRNFIFDAAAPAFLAYTSPRGPW